MRNPLRLLGIFLVVVGVGYFIGAGYTYYRVQGGYGSLQAFSEQQNVELSYNDDGELVDRGTVEGGQAIMSLLEDDWNFPVVDGDMDPDDPLVNTASEYMYQMATISYHTLHGEQTVTLTQDDIDAAIAAERLDPDGTYNGVVGAYQGQVLEPGDYTVPVDGRYWTGFNRTDLLDGPARDMAWSGTAHALVAELGVGAATHSSLQLGLGIVGLLAGLGVVCSVTGGLLLMSQRKRNGTPESAPEPMVKDQEGELATV